MLLLAMNDANRKGGILIVLAALILFALLLVVAIAAISLSVSFRHSRRVMRQERSDLDQPLLRMASGRPRPRR